MIRPYYTAGALAAVLLIVVIIIALQVFGFL